MVFLQSFILVISILIILCIAFYAYKHRKEASAGIELFYLMIAATIWTLGSYFELLAQSLEWKIIFRNIQQVGVFSTPILTLYFAIAYTKRKKIYPFAYAATVVPVTALILILTNRFHGFMRKGYEMIDGGLFGQIMVVDQTVLGLLMVGFNFVIPLISIAILIHFSFCISKDLRKQVYVIIASFFLTFLGTWLKMAILSDQGIHISISTLYLPAAILMLYGLFKHNFFSISPIARDKVFHVITQGIIVLSKEGLISDYNEKARYYLERYTENQKELSKKSLHELMKEKDKKLIKSFNDDWTSELMFEDQGQQNYITLNHYLLKDEQDIKIGSILVIENITGRKESEFRLTKLAIYDGLTKIFNRVGFDQQYYELNKTHPDSVSFMMIDIDHFKGVNDAHGHSGGDTVLYEFAKQLKKHFQGCIVSRMGGEEFLIVCSNSSIEEAYNLAENFRLLIQKHAIIIKKEFKVHITISIGLSYCQKPIKNHLKLIEEADQALYQAKDNTRNATVIYKKT